MTTIFNALAAGLIGAAAIISGANAGPIATVNSSADQGRSAATPVSTAQPSSRIYCFSGVTGTPAMQSRGWVCQREAAPADEKHGDQ